ncbi:protein-tyrosine phosphatase [Devosia sp. UYZn731]|uniref:tyrosine-protein phosphatase n=1 Tax=Devosia sp. UYZn731 TaxID=3156345 RepID=UPI00339B1ECE
MPSAASTYLLPSLGNFRDLGGLPAGEGRTIRLRLFYRSPRLTGLSAEDTAWLDVQDIGAVVDLRGVEESLAAPIAVSPALTGRRVALSIEPSASPRIRAAEAQGPATFEMVREIMIDGYRAYVSAHAETYAKFLRLLAATEAPVVFHCSAGKDRTGVAAALLLAALGVPKAAIEADFLRTNDDWQPPADIGERVPESYRRALLGVELAYLEAAFDALERQHGGAVQFARNALGGRQALYDFRMRVTELAPA